jgi:hypothetical protein
VTDDDAPNQAPTGHLPRTPADGSAGVPSTPTLAWSSSDPDVGDTVTHDVYLGTVFSTTGQQWLPVCPAGELAAPRWGAVSGYDEANDRLIVYGGETPDGPADTDLLVLLNASASGGVPQWQRIPTTSGPGALVHAAGGYDPVTNRLVVFGGCLGSCDAPSDETWVLTGANGLGGPVEWQQLAVAGPVARFGHAAAHDRAGNRLVVYGGAAGEAGETLGDLWVLEGANGLGTSAWILVDTGPDGPVARAHPSLARDPVTGALVLFGGQDGAGNALGDVWTLPGTGPGPGAAWTALSPSGASPAGRFGHGAAFDPASGRLLVYGGSTAGFEDGVNYVFDDTWMLTGARGESPPAEWNRVDGGGTAPLGRLSAAVVWAPGASRLIVAGGANNKLALPPADLWLLDDAFGELPLVSADQLEPSYLATEAETGEVFYWRVVTRDDHGAWRGSPAWSFTTNGPPLVDAGPDLSTELPPGTVDLLGTVSWWTVRPRWHSQTRHRRSRAPASPLQASTRSAWSGATARPRLVTTCGSTSGPRTWPRSWTPAPISWV